ncbi:MAG TPA: DUF5615 family PIN-like protein [Armatimonadota bacterium]
MLTLLADEDLNNAILRGIHRRLSDGFVRRVQDVGLGGCPDATILEYCAEHQMVLVTHDVTTMTSEAVWRIRTGLSMPGVLVVRQSAPLRAVVDDLVMFLECGTEEDVASQILYLPLPGIAHQ